jgi:hypothetical protein
MILGDGYCSPATRARRQAAADLQRVGGVDGNVSNLAVVSFPRSYSPADGDVASTRVSLSEEEKARQTQKHRKDRARQRALHRSRRASNPQQYHLSRGQRKRAERRAAAGLQERQLVVRSGGRLVEASGRPRQSYRSDGVAPLCSAPGRHGSTPETQGQKGVCLCSAECRSLPRADPGWEHRLTTGSHGRNPDSQNGQNFWDRA